MDGVCVLSLSGINQSLVPTYLHATDHAYSYLPTYAYSDSLARNEQQAS